MASNQYFQDELDYLRNLGAQFAKEHPNLVRFLGQSGGDPDVERLLEGFAFLSGRLRQKLDDELPEITHALMSLLYPHFLRPVPAMSIVQFSPAGRITGKRTVRRSTELDSIPVDGTRCRFRTCYDVDIYPLSLERVELMRASASSRLQLRFVSDGEISIDALGLSTIRLYLSGNQFVSQTLYLWLMKYLDKILIQPIEAQNSGFSLQSKAIVGVGFDEKEALLEYPPTSFVGCRLLQEYFALPQKFLFVDITGLEPLRDSLKIGYPNLRAILRTTTGWRYSYGVH